MLREADLVVRGKVTVGGESRATVAVEEVLFGEPPGAELSVVGFNNGRWPAEARKKESLAQGERYLFLLLRSPKGGYQVFPPSAGEFPIEGDKVRASVERAGWPRSAEPVPLADFERWVKSGLGRRSGRAADRGVCDAQVRRLARAAERLNALQVLLVAGEDTWSEAFSPVLASDNENERAALALLLGGIQGAKAVRVGAQGARGSAGRVRLRGHRRPGGNGEGVDGGGDAAVPRAPRAVRAGP